MPSNFHLSRLKEGVRNAFTQIKDEKYRMDSRAPRLHYPHGSFSDRSGPQLMRHGRSLGHAFALGSLVVKDPIRPPFALTLFSRFLTLMRRSLGTSDRFSEVYRPSQTAHLMLSPILRNEGGFPIEGVSDTFLLSFHLLSTRDKQYESDRVVLHWRLSSGLRHYSIATTYAIRSPSYHNIKLQ